MLKCSDCETKETLWFAYLVGLFDAEDIRNFSQRYWQQFVIGDGIPVFYYYYVKIC